MLHMISFSHMDSNLSASTYFPNEYGTYSLLTVSSWFFFEICHDWQSLVSLTILLCSDCTSSNSSVFYWNFDTVTVCEGRFAASGLLGLQVWIPLGAQVFCQCWILSGRDLRDGPIPFPEKCCRVCSCYWAWSSEKITLYAYIV